MARARARARRFCTALDRSIRSTVDMQDNDMPRIRLEWRDRARKQTPRPERHLHGNEQRLWCDVLTLAPRLRLRWSHTEEQAEEGDVWECGAVWVHCAYLENGDMSGYTADVHRDLEAALNVIASDPIKARYTLLVTPDGMSYDATRLGGDHQVNLTNGRCFTFSVRRGAARGHKMLMALCWNNRRV